MAIGIMPKDTANVPGRGNVSEGICCVVGVQTEAGTATYNLYDANGVPHPMRIIRVWGHMTGVGAAADTVVVNRVSAGTAYAITDTVPLNTLTGGTETFDMAELDDYSGAGAGAQWLLHPGDGLQVVTASDALCVIYVMYIKNSEVS